MLKIIAAELKYLRYGQVKFFLPVTVITIILVYKTVNVINMLVWMTSLSITANVIGIKSKELRGQLLVPFPIKRKKLALMRVLITLLPAGTFFIVGFIAQLLYTGYHEAWYDGIYELTMLFGLLTAGFNFYFYLSDTVSLFKSANGRIIFNITAVTIILIICVIIAIAVKNLFINSFYSGVISIGILLLAGIIMIFISINSYDQRESLLD